jgi:hypothetical protein
MVQLKKDNFNIKTLKYSEIAYDVSGFRFTYDLTGAGADILVSDYMKTKSKSLENLNIPNFDAIVYDIIKSWKRSYKFGLTVLDGLFWELEIELKDGTKYSFSGYHETPENFSSLRILFDGILKLL